MNKLIKYFNEKYSKEYGKISYPRTTIQIYRVYQAIKSYGINDNKLVELLHNIKLPKPRNTEEWELYVCCLYNMDDSELERKIEDIPKKTIVEDNKLYLIKSDGTKMGEGTELPSTDVSKKYIDTSLENKVDKVNGKGLSTVDFTKSYETKLNKLENYDDSSVKNNIQNVQQEVVQARGEYGTLNERLNADDKFKSIIKYGNENLSAERYTIAVGNRMATNLVPILSDGVVSVTVVNLYNNVTIQHLRYDETDKTMKVIGTKKATGLTPKSVSTIPCDFNFEIDGNDYVACMNVGYSNSSVDLDGINGYKFLGELNDTSYNLSDFNKNKSSMIGMCVNVLTLSSVTKTNEQVNKNINSINETEFETNNLQNRCNKLEKLDTFKWKNFDKSYFALVFDDGNNMLNDFYTLSHNKGIPISSACPASSLINITNGVPILSILKNIELDGGEILAHYFGSPTDESSDEEWMKYTRNQKKALQDAGLTVRGLIRADRTQANSKKGEKYCRLYFDYADSMGISPQYNLGNRKFLIGVKTLDEMKKWIDTCCLNPGFYPICIHGLRNDEPLATVDGISSIIDYIKSKNNVEFTTYSKMFDSFGSTKLETDIEAGSGTSIDDSNTATDKTWSSSKIDSQFKDIAKQTITEEERNKLTNLNNYDDTSIKNDMKVQKTRIDTLATLKEGSTTGDAELIDARIGADGNTYTNLGDGIRTQLTNINTKLNNIDGETIKTVVKEKQITLAGYKTSDQLIDKLDTTKKYIVLIKDGTTNIKLALDKDQYGNGRSIFSNSHNGYAINETNQSLYIFNMYDTTWTGTICVVEITDNTELEQYLITNGYNAINYNWKGQLNELHQNLNTVYRQKINIFKNDSETVILEKFTNAYNIGNCDVVFEPGTYTFSDIFNHTNEEIPIGSNCHYYFNGSTINATKPDGITATRNMFGSLRTGGNYELYDGILIGNSLTYIVHDEASANKEMYIRKYHNMIMQNNTGTNTDEIRKCIGGGTGCHGVVEIDSCIFLADFGVDVSYHGIDYSLNDTAEFILVVKNSYFNKALRLDGLGKNQTGTLIYSGNNKQPNEARPNGWTVYEFNNNKLTN